METAAWWAERRYRYPTPKFHPKRPLGYFRETTLIVAVYAFAAQAREEPHVLLKYGLQVLHLSQRDPA